MKVTCSIRFIILCSTVLKQNMQNFSEVTRKYHQIEEVEWLPSKKFKLFYWDFNLKVVKFYFERHFCCGRYKTQVTAHRSRTRVTGPGHRSQAILPVVLRVKEMAKVTHCIGTWRVPPLVWMPGDLETRLCHRSTRRNLERGSENYRLYWNVSCRFWFVATYIVRFWRSGSILKPFKLWKRS